MLSYTLLFIPLIWARVKVNPDFTEPTVSDGNKHTVEVKLQSNIPGHRAATCRLSPRTTRLPPTASDGSLSPGNGFRVRCFPELHTAAVEVTRTAQTETSPGSCVRLGRGVSTLRFGFGVKGTERTRDTGRSAASKLTNCSPPDVTGGGQSPPTTPSPTVYTVKVTKYEYFYASTALLQI